MDRLEEIKNLMRIEVTQGSDEERRVVGQLLVEELPYLISEVERLREREEIHWPYELDMAQREIIRLGGTVETNDGIALQA